MADIDRLKDELSMGLKLIAFKPLTVQLTQFEDLTAAMQANGWSAISETSDDGNGTLCRYFYDTLQKNYALATFAAAAGSCNIAQADETDVLEKLSFPDLKVLAGLIDKKSVAFIRIYSEKELAAASGEERAALEERNQKMIDEAEVALRKR